MCTDFMGLYIQVNEWNILFKDNSSGKLILSIMNTVNTPNEQETKTVSYLKRYTGVKETYPYHL